MICNGAVRLTAQRNAGQFVEPELLDRREVSDHGVVDDDIGAVERIGGEAHQAGPPRQRRQDRPAIGRGDTMARFQRIADRLHRLRIFEPVQDDIESRGSQALRHGVTDARRWSRSPARTDATYPSGAALARRHVERMAMPSSSADGAGYSSITCGSWPGMI